MNLDLIMEIAELALSLVNNALNGNQSSASATSTLLQILQKGAQAYQQHTGQPLDPTLITAEAPV
jgi:hypothetical protein